MNPTVVASGVKVEYFARLEAESDIVCEIESYKPIVWRLLISMFSIARGADRGQLIAVVGNDDEPDMLLASH